MEDRPSTKKFASTAAYVGAFLFAILMVLFSTSAPGFAICIIAVAFHVVLLPVVSELPSTDWAKACGYGWIILDTASNIMQLNGVDEHITSSLRLGAHIPAIIWIITSSLKSNRPMRVVGILQALVMGSYSFVAPWVPVWYLYPAIILLIVWLIITGRFLSKLI